MNTPSILRVALLLAALPFLVASECDFTEIVNALCAHDPDHPNCPTEKVVFVTSTLHTGDFGGLAGADAVCQARADASPLAGKTFVAWLSSSTVDARDRLTNPGPPGFVRPDGVVVAESVADLTDGALDARIDRAEDNSAGPKFVWTGTEFDGTAEADTCSDWTSLAGSGRVGRSDLTNTNWTRTALTPCSAMVRALYCFET